MRISINDLKFNEEGLMPVIVQDAGTRGVLMLAYMNEASLTRTLETGETWFWSRSRAELWHKGVTTGNRQRIVEMRLDCDSDSLLVIVEAQGPACHTGAWSCFQNQLEGSEGEGSRKVELSLGRVLCELDGVVRARERARPEGSYTARLFDEGLDKILAKISEEAGETIIAAKNEDRDALCSEVCDLLYHLVVLLVERSVSLDRIRDELSSRRKQ